MKKYFVIAAIICSLFIPSFASAQNYYSEDEITIGWRYWTDTYSWDYLISNGKPVTISCSPNLNAEGSYLSFPTEIVATCLRHNKFLVLTFSKRLGIRLRCDNTPVQLSKYYSWSQVMNQSWFEIDYEHIIYDATYDRIMIPCGTDYSGYPNALCIDLKDTSAARSVEVDRKEGKTRYYDLSGKAVDLEESNGKVVIKTDGRKSVKIINK